MLGIACSDAGGAEIVASWLRENKQKFIISANSPAKEIFQSQFSHINFVSSEVLVKESKKIITGTGFSNFEIKVVQNAKKNNIRTISILDHWINYEERFFKNSLKILPDEIWVCDKFALMKAKKIFDVKIIKNIGNPYFRRLKKEYSLFKNKKLKGKKKLLYVGSSNIPQYFKKSNNDYKLYKYNEMQAVKFFFNKIKNSKYRSYLICYRPHPSKSKDKYMWIKKRYGKKYNIELSDAPNLINDIFSSNVVVGCNSMALAVAANVCKKKTINAIPFKNVKNNLPYKSIFLLR